MDADTVTQIIIIASPVIWIVWDVYVFKTKGNAWTESAVMWKWAVRMPGIAFLVGLLMGHFFFQQYLPTAFAKDDKGVIYQVGPYPLSPGQILTVTPQGLFVPKGP